MSSAQKHPVSTEVWLERQIEAFDLAWQASQAQAGQAPRIENFLATVPGEHADAESLRCELLWELIKIDLEYRWRAAADSQQNPEPALLLEDYAQRFPDLGAIDELPVDLIGEEYRVRRKWGDRPSADDYFARFPRLSEILQFVLQAVDEESLAETSGKGAETHIRPTDAPLAPKFESAQTAPYARPKSSTALPKTIGRYQVVSLLGQGSFGAVYLADDAQLGRRVAIKAPRPDLLRLPGQLDAFLREARLTAQARHPALVEVFDVGRDETHGCYIVMEYIQGRPLNEVSGGQSVDFGQAAEWIAAVAEGVHCAHKIGLVHCDLKPANILIDLHDRPHVADFGLVVSEADQRKQAGMVAGSPIYMSPEQIRGEAHRFDGRTDLWALGVILYELLTGRKPFSGNNVQQAWDEILHREPKPPRQINEAIPADLETICLQCLAKEVRERFTNGFDLAADLRAALENLRTGRIVRPRPAQRAAVGELTHRSLPAGRSNLPASHATTFIGRERELAELTDWLADPHAQLITLLGPGGMGKTRIAAQLVQNCAEQRPGGCWFAELTECRAAADIAQAVAAALGVTLPDNESPVQAVAHVLEFRKPLLLVLDNFEQAVDAAQATVGLWRQAAPQSQFLVTSRAALGLTGERTFELEPLGVPGGSEQLGPADVDRFTSLRLFCERAAEAQHGFRVDAQKLPAIAAICAAVDGIPLAVELAAARVKVLTPEEIAKRLHQRFQVLQSARRDLTPRQQTLWGAIAWSVDLLKDWERHAFLQVCVFRGGFDWDAAEAVVDLSLFPQAPPVLDVIQGLRDKSLLTRQDTPFGTRFGLYQSIREYGERCWQTEVDPALQQSFRQRLAEHFIAWADRWSARIFTADGVEALARLRLEMENLFAVQDQALARGDAITATRAILAVAPAMAIRGPADQRLPRLERALVALESASGTPSPAGSGSNFHAARSELEGSMQQMSLPAAATVSAPVVPPPLLAALLTAASEAAQAAGDWNRATEWANRAATAAAACEQRALLAAALRQQGEMHRQRGEPDAALASFAAAENLCRTLNDRHGLACCLAARGFVVWQRGDAESALRLLTEGEQIVFADGALLDGIPIARRRGHILAQRGDTFAALRCYAEAEATARSAGDERSVRLAIGERANVLAMQGDYNGALECYQQAEQLARRLGDKRGLAITIGNQGILCADRGEPAAALACYEQAEALNRALQSRYGIAVNTGNRGVALADLGRHQEALACFAEAEALNRQMGNKFLLGLNRGDRAAVLQQQGRLTEAREELAAALALLDEVQSGHSMEAFGYQARLAVINAALSDATAAENAATAARHLADELQLTETHPKAKIRTLLTELGMLSG